jgi:chromosome segregation protein
VLDIPVELEVAISAALGEYTDSVLLSSGQDAEQALVLLDSDQSGRASILPLDWLSPAEPLKTKPDTNCLGVAADLIKAPAELRPALDLLLGQVLVVRDRTAARRVLAGQPKNVRVVTLRGEVFHATGQVQAGKSAGTAALGRPRQRRELHESLVEVEHQIAELDTEIKNITNQIAKVQRHELDCQDRVGDSRTGLEKIREIERQAQVRDETAHRQHRD